MFDYKISKHPHFDEACRAFALRHNMAKLAERAEMNVQTLRNKLNPEQPHQLTAPEIWLLTDLTEDSTLVDGFLAQIHCLPCVPINEVAKEKLPHYVMSATAEIGRVAAGAVNRRPSTQFLGPENDMLTLSGVLMPEITGGRLSLLALEQMAEQGKAWPLIEGSGTIYGMYVIEGLNQTKTEFFRDGMPRRIEFTLSLKRVDESLSDMFGDLSAQLNNLQDTATSALSDISKTVGGLLS
ncbi:phage regulatory CII family protein [Escherichia coli]|uniref:phage regulatory CII family protein n=2 Tax=Escherichia coli TaxID=562 RepID=UPI001D133155